MYRIEFNQSGSWRAGPEFAPAKERRVKALSIDLATACSCHKLRITTLIGADRRVLEYWDAVNGWHRPAR